MNHRGVVLITGLNGYLASHAAQAFLAAGFRVRGTVRHISKARQVQEILSGLGYGNRLEIEEVKDITKPGAFDTAIRGCQAVVHMASLIVADLYGMKATDVMKVNVQGTTSILQSALDFAGPQLQSVVFLSVVTTIAPPPPHIEKRLYTETDWDTISEGQVEQLANELDALTSYRVGKIAAERAFWRFRDEFKPRFSMTALHPSFVMGPPLVLPAHPDDMKFSASLVWKIFSGQDIPPPLASKLVGQHDPWVDVRDLARTAVFMVEHWQATDAQRFICSSAVAVPQAIADILRKRYPERSGVIKVGNPGEGYNGSFSNIRGETGFDGSKVTLITRRKWIPFDQSVIDTAEAFQKYYA
ncbi:NAD(P)-binding protein [Hypoxylon crocopeplum]|nr:NAD(P)-binding protein [Hypoxylon crocopeplum]